MGVTRDTLINIPRGMGYQQLERISRILTARLQGCPLQDVSTVSIPELQADLESQRAFLNETMAALHRTLDAGPGGVQLAGATNILNYPEYSDMAKAKNFLATIEAKDVLYKILSEAADVEFSIKIGRENQDKDMQDCSVVTATYKVGGAAVGTLGVIGPVRMDYARVLALMRHIGRSMSDVLTNMMEEER